MDKKSEQSKSTKMVGDVDIGTHKYGMGNVREQLNGLWAVAGKEVVGLSPSRVITNDYAKEKGKRNVQGGDKDIMESLLESGPPIMNMSKPHRVF